MNAKPYIRIATFLLFFTFTGAGCKKGWLDEKPQLSLTVPTTIADFQALLDNSNSSGVMPIYTRQPGVSDVISGEFTVTSAVLGGRDQLEQNLYKWTADPYKDVASFIDWDRPYQVIFYTNVVIDGLDKIDSTGSNKIPWGQAKGQAYFLRAYFHFVLAELFCNVYDKNTAANELGIPLRVESDFNIPSVRSTIRETYNQILSDLEQARRLLPVSTPISNTYKLRPTKAAAEAMLARVYIAMSDYDNALSTSNRALLLYDTLMNYGALSSAGKTPAVEYNPEVIFHMTPSGYGINTSTRAIVKADLYSQYVTNDLRRTFYFRISGGNVQYRGSYFGIGNKFTGLATDELYLIRAESRARKGDHIKAMEDLNYLLERRWVTGTFVPYVATDASDALVQVLKERRKELCFRCLRWTDLRRLNKEPQFQYTPERVVDGQPFSLPPGDLRYTLLIPPNIIQLSGIQQNPR